MKEAGWARWMSGEDVAGRMAHFMKDLWSLGCSLVCPRLQTLCEQISPDAGEWSPESGPGSDGHVWVGACLLDYKGK